MADPRQCLFAVEYRRSGEDQAHTAFVPASNADEAILRAQATLLELRLAGHDVSNPFQNHLGFEVRTGKFRSGEATEIEFGDWSSFPPVA